MLALTVTLGLAALSWPASSQDETILLVFPERVLRGDLPYLDFSTAYGPGGWWALAGLYKLTGPSVLSERMLGIAAHALLALAMTRLGLQRRRTLGLAMGVTSSVILFPLGAAPYAWIVACALAIAGLVTLTAGTGPRQQRLAGFAAGLAIAWRPDACLLAVLPQLVLLRSAPRRGPWLAGLTVGILPLLIAAGAAPGAFLHDVILGRILGSAAQSRLPLPPRDSSLALLLGGVVGTALLAVFVALLTKKGRHRSLALLAIFALPQALQRADAAHLLYTAAVVLPLLPLLLYDLAQSTWRPARRFASPPLMLGSLMIGSVITGPVLVPLTLAATGRGPSSVSVRHDGRQLPESAARARTLELLLKEVDTLARPRDELFVFPSDLSLPAVNDVGVYHLLPALESHARNVEITPGVTNQAGSHLLDDVLHADIIVLVDDGDLVRQLLPYEVRGSEAVTHALRQHYCTVSVIEYYEVLRRRAEGNGRRCLDARS